MVTNKNDKLWIIGLVLLGTFLILANQNDSNQEFALYCDLPFYQTYIDNWSYSFDGATWQTAMLPFNYAYASTGTSVRSITSYSCPVVSCPGDCSSCSACSYPAYSAPFFQCYYPSPKVETFNVWDGTHDTIYVKKQLYGQINSFYLDIQGSITCTIDGTSWSGSTGATNIASRFDSTTNSHLIECSVTRIGDYSRFDIQSQSIIELEPPCPNECWLCLNGDSCSLDADCVGGYCVNNICRSTSTYCGDSVCDTGETCLTCEGDCGKCPDEYECSTDTQCAGGHCVHEICRSTSTYCGDDFCDVGEIYGATCIADCWVIGASPLSENETSETTTNTTTTTTTYVPLVPSYTPPTTSGGYWSPTSSASPEFEQSSTTTILFIGAAVIAFRFMFKKKLRGGKK